MPALDVHDLGPAAAGSETRRAAVTHDLDHSDVEPALEQLYRDEARQVRDLFVLRGCNPSDAEDLLHESWIVVRRKSTGSDPPTSLRAYFFGVAVMVCTAQLRKYRQLRDGAPLEPTNERASVPEETSAVDDRVVLGQAPVRNALDALPDRQRQAFLLRTYFDLTLAEVAEAMGITVDAVKSHLQLARRKIAGIREQEGAS